MNKSEQEYKNKLMLMSNNELWVEFRDVYCPDDYDGCWTNWGWNVREICEDEFFRRLLEIGFLTEEIVE